MSLDNLEMIWKIDYFWKILLNVLSTVQCNILHEHQNIIHMNIFFNKESNCYTTCCVLQEFADAIFHLVREKYTELAGCSSLLHARHKGLAGIVMTRGMASFQSACELFKKFNKGRESTSKSLCIL